MINSVIGAAHSLVWAALIMLLNIFIFAIFIMAQINVYLKEFPDSPKKDEMLHYFGSLGHASYTLFGVATGGIDWMDIEDILLYMSWFNGAVLIFYIFFTQFCLINIITGIFVDTAINTAAAD